MGRGNRQGGMAIATDRAGTGAGPYGFGIGYNLNDSIFKGGRRRTKDVAE